MAAAGVPHLNGVALDGNSTLSLQIHVVQGLLLELALTHRSGLLEKAIRQSALAVIDVGDDAEVANVLHSKG